MDRNDIIEIDAILAENPETTIQELRDIILLEVNRNELKRKLIEYWNNIYMRIWNIINDNIEHIEAIESDDDKLSFIISIAFKQYLEYTNKEKETNGRDENNGQWDLT